MKRQNIYKILVLASPALLVVLFLARSTAFTQSEPVQYRIEWDGNPSTVCQNTNRNVVLTVSDYQIIGFRSDGVVVWRILQT
jgi:hypothetical protein